jgi:hypothetical protein
LTEEHFTLPVLYNDREFEFPARLATMGYTYKIFVQVNDVEIIYEPDEERNFRAVLDHRYNEGNKKIDTNLIKAIGAALEHNLK